MKIAIVQPRVSYYSGGGERIPLVHAKLLSEHGHEVIIYTTDVKGVDQSSFFKEIIGFKSNLLKIKQFEIPNKFKFLYSQPAGEDRNRWDTESLLFNQLIFDELKNDSPDILLTYYILDGIFRPLNLPSILYLVGYPSDKLDIRKSFLRFFDATISISNNVKNQWGEYLDEVKNNFVLNPGVEIDQKKTKVKSEFNFNIVFAGRLIERKGLVILLKAMKIITKKYPDIHLWILGDGPQKEKLMNKIKELKLENRVSLIGWVNNINDYFRMADICVFPSLEKEGLMGVVLEAMALGKPVVTTTKNGNEDVIKDGFSGILVEPENIEQLSNAIIDLFKDQNRRKELGENAKICVTENLTLEKFYDKFIQIIKQVKNYGLSKRIS